MKAPIPSTTKLSILFVLVNPFVFVTCQDNGHETEACDILIAYDDTVMDDFNQSIPDIQRSISSYIRRVNQIYKATIFKDAPNERIHFTIGKWVRLKDFARHPDDPNKLCENHGIVLSEFSHAVDTSKYCLGHLFTKRNFGCIVGLGYVGTACTLYTNTAFTVLRKDNFNGTVNTIAHEIGHNFGSKHDGENSLAYKRCNNETKNEGIMGGKKQFSDDSKSFSTCSKAAMIATLQKIHGQEQKKKDDGKATCLKFEGKSLDYKAEPETIIWKKTDFVCPDPEPDETPCGENDPPDPPLPPEEPPPPECGNLKVEEISQEECDCGKTHEECDDPCCYPLNITSEDLRLNASAMGCRRHTSGLCQNPNESTIKFGLIIPLIAFLIGVLLLALILFVDWRYGRRYCYGHILQRKDYIHCEDEEQRRRRIERGNILD